MREGKFVFGKQRQGLWVASAAAVPLLGLVGAVGGTVAQASAASAACPASTASITVWLSDAGSAGDALFNKTAAAFEKACPETPARFASAMNNYQ